MLYVKGKNIVSVIVPQVIVLLFVCVTICALSLQNINT